MSTRLAGADVYEPRGRVVSIVEYWDGIERGTTIGRPPFTARWRLFRVVSGQGLSVTELPESGRGNSQQKPTSLVRRRRPNRRGLGDGRDRDAARRRAARPVSYASDEAALEAAARRERSPVNGGHWIGGNVRHLSIDEVGFRVASPKAA